MKTVSDATPNVGDVITFTLAVTNNGPSDATGVAFEDVVPNGYSNITNISNGGTLSGNVITWSGFDIAKGATATVTFEVTVEAPGAGVDYVNVAEVTDSDQHDPDSTPDNDDGDQSEDDEDNEDVTPQQADLELIKTVNNSMPDVGTTVTFTIEVLNNGPSDASGVAVEDVVPNGYTNVTNISNGGTLSGNVLTWNGLNIPTGTSIFLTFDVTIEPTGDYLNTAQVTDSDQHDPDSTPDNDDGDQSEDDEDNEEVDPNPIIDLELDKSVSDAMPDEGSDITFTLELTNQGPNNATGVVVTDQLPAGFTFVSTTGSYDNVSGEWTVGNLAVGETVTVDITVTVNEDGPYVNLAEVTAANEDDIDSTPNNGVDTDGDTVVDDDPDDEDDGDGVTVEPVEMTASIDIEKSTNGQDADVAPGAIILTNPNSPATVTWTYTVTNTGTLDLINVQVTDDQEGLVGTIPLLAAGATQTLTLDGSAQLGMYGNLGTADGQPIGGNGNPFGDPVSDNDPSNYTGVFINVEKQANTDEVCAGEEVTYTLITRMLGGAPGVQIRNISVVDNNLPGETLTSNHPYFIASSDVSNNDMIEFIDNDNDGNSDEEFMWEYTLTLTQTTVNIANDMGTVFYVDPSGNELEIGDVGNTDQVTVNVITPEVAIDITPANQDVIYGDDATFTVTVTNTGDVDLENVTVVDSEGNADCEMTITSLAVGASQSFTCTLPAITQNVTIDFDVTAGGLGSAGNALCSVTAEATAIVTVVPLIDLELAKSVTPSAQNVGEDVTFTIEVTNQGPAPATGVSVGDLLPSGFTYVSSTGGYDEPTAEWVIGDMGIGETVSMTITATVNASGDYVNVAQVIAADQDDVDSTPNNDDGDQSEDDEDNAEVTPIPVIDLELDKQVNNQFPFVGDNIIFTLELTNQGPSDATGVVVTDQLPAGFTYVSSNGSYNSATGEWSVGDLAMGQTVTLDITVTVTSIPEWTNLAEVTAANEQDIDSTPDNGVDTDGDGLVQDDPDDEDDGDGLGVAPVAQVDISLVKTVDQPIAQVGETVTFTLTVTNDGPNDATGILVEDHLPSGFTFVMASADYNEATGIWDVGALGVGNSETIEIVATVNETGDHKNIAEVVATDQDDIDSTPDNDDGDQSEDDEDNAEVIIDVVIDLELTKSVSPTSVMVGEEVTFKIDVTNQGPSTATGVTIEDILQSGFTFTGTNGAYDEVAGLWDIGTLAIGETVSLEITATVNEDGVYTNDAQVLTANEDDIDSTPGNGVDNGEDDEDGVEVNIECELMIEVTDVVCDNGGTASDSSDDTYTFVLNVTGNGVTDGWTATIAGETTNGAYGQDVQFGPYNIELVGDITFEVIDANELGCREFVSVDAPETCSNECLIVAESANVYCDDNGTPSDPTDDLFFFDLVVTENYNSGSGWTASVNGTVILPFAGYISQVQAENLGGFPIAGSTTYPLVNGMMEVLISDVDDPNCTTTVLVPVPETCSDECGIIFSDVTTDCDPNGTLSDPSDDLFSVTLTVTGNNAGNNGWIASNGQTGAYGATVTLTGFAIGNGAPVGITFTDVDDPTCTSVLTVTPPAPCSDQCDITAQVLNVLCDDNGTPAVIEDDTYTFDVLVTGVNTGNNGWTDADGNAGTYGALESYGPFSIMDDPSITLSIQDATDPSCTTTLTVNAPAPCSDACFIDAVEVDILCVDSGTPSDASDDVYYAYVMVTANANASTSWIANGNIGSEGPTTGEYNTSDSYVFGPYQPGTTVQINFVDSGDSGCTDGLTMQMPDSGCSDACDIAATNISTLCDDNGTGFDPSDDQWYMVFELDGMNTGSCWTDSEGNSGTYPAVISYGPYPASQDMVAITITDCDDPTCSTTAIAFSPGPCSDDCEVDPQIIDIYCLDNDTPQDPADDQYEAVINVTPTGTVSGLGWRWKVLPNGNYSSPQPYNQDITVGTFDIADGNVTIRISDAGNTGCFYDLELEAPALCSEPCDMMAEYINQVCDDNGTPDDPSDDTYSFELLVTNPTSTGNTWFATTQNLGNISGMFDVPFLIEGIPANEPTVILTITDAHNMGCMILDFVVPPTGPCSDDCSITASASNPICDNNGTPLDSSDDTYSFELTVSAINNAGTNWTATINGQQYNEPYGTITISGVDANTTLVIDNIAAANNPTCTADVVSVQATGPCSMDCSITASASDPVCDDNGTPTDPSDDTYSFELTVSAINNAGTNWTATINGQQYNEPYGTITISNVDPNTTLVIDNIAAANDPTCTANVVTVQATGTCSDELPCDISAEIIDMSTACNDGGTLGDENDDTFTFEAIVTNLGMGTSWTAVDDTYGIVNNGGYGSAESFGPYPASDYGTTITITITDDEDPTCQTTLTIEIPQCNDCTITGNISNVLCNDQGTSDPYDDTFTFELYITGENVGTTWTSNDTTITNGNFNETYTFGPYNIMSFLDNNMDLVFHITPDANDNCELTVLVDPPLPCSPIDCEISADISDILCDDNGTPNDPTDDTYTFTAVVNPGLAGGAFALTYINGSTVPEVAMYGVPVTYGPFPILVDTEIKWVDGADPECMITETVTSPQPCSNTPADCEISAAIEIDDCVTNGPGNADDEVYVTITVTPGINVGPNDTWTTTPGGFTGNYNEPTTFGPFPVGTDLNFTISNVGASSCSTDVFLDMPDECADMPPCILSANAFNINCDDNGTADPNDDTFSFFLLVTAEPGVTTWEFEFDGVIYDGDVNVPTFNPIVLPVSGLPAGNNGELTIPIYDANNIDCFTALSIVVPIVPEIECPDDTDVASVTQDVQFINGQLTSDDDTLDSLCWAEGGAFGTHYFDSMTVIPNATDVYTFVLLSDMASGNINEGWGAIFDGAYNGLMPCCNILDTTHVPGLANAVDFETPMLDFANWNLGGYAPVGSMTIQLLGGHEYTLLTTSLQAGVTGAYRWAIFSQDGGQLTDMFQVPFLSQEGPVLYDLLCNDYEYLLDEMLSVAYTGNAEVGESCGVDSFFFNDQLLLGADCKADTIVRTFTVTDVQGNAYSCEQAITVNVPTLDDVKMPVLTARFDCGEFFVEDGNGHPHPSVTGYPYVLTAFGVNVLDEDPYCNLSASYVDEVESICNSSYTIYRTWTIDDDCNPGELSTYVQTIKVGDLEGPVVSCPISNHYCPVIEEDIMLFNTDPFDCTATIEVPMPEVSDACSDDWEVITEIVQYVGQQEIVITTILPGEPRLITGIELGDYVFRYIVTDDCGNTTIQECIFRVADLSEPVAICDNGMNISVGGSGLARIYWHQVDDGSYDNCGIDSILIRRVYTSDPEDCTPLTFPTYSDWGPYVDFTCCDAGSYVTVELRVVDVIGNVNMCWMDVLIEDKTLPYCYGLEDVQAACGSLPNGFDPYNLDQLNEAFGESHVFDNCSAETIQLEPIVELSDCGNGTIIRRFLAVDLVGNVSLDTFLQVVTIGGAGGYDIHFPADTVMTCGDVLADTMTQVYYSGCDSITVSFTDTLVAGLGDECYRILRTYDVINHCQYDGFSDPVVVGRDEDCDAIPGDEDVWVLYRLDTTFVDADSLAYNLFPLAGTKDTICDGNTNPEGYWRTSIVNGYWQYTQVISVYDSIAPVITFTTPDPFCNYEEEGMDCEGLVEYAFSVNDNCLPDSLWLTDTVSFRVLLDTLADGTIDVDVTDFVSIDGSYPDYIITGDFPLGTHAFQLEATDACGNTTVDSLPFEVVDCFVAAPNVYDGLVVELMPLGVEVDIDEDGDMDNAAIEVMVDFLLEGEQLQDCNGPVVFSINRVGEEIDPEQQSLILTCDDTSRLDVEIWAWDYAYNPYAVQPDGTIGGRNRNMAESTITIQNMSNVCDPGLDLPDPNGGALQLEDKIQPELHQNKPNPFFNQTTISFWLPEAGEANLTVYDISGKELKVVDGYYDAGYHEVEIQRNEVPSFGVYFYTLRTGTFIDTKQMILLE
ncbi:MAG: T9SS type A sorting domain-containing protein [Chitinophagales bacterium]|nr:T9SS type A sorting domain-containing protein [Chitinophagales bacterium]